MGPLLSFWPLFLSPFTLGSRFGLGFPCALYVIAPLLSVNLDALKHYLKIIESNPKEFGKNTRSSGSMRGCINS